MSCSTEKNTALTRTYHNITAKYNVYFNGNEAFQRGINRINSQYSENYNQILPIFPESVEQAASIATADMDRAIAKASKTIKLHSITAKPERRGSGPMSQREREFYEKNEYCKWIDDSYLLMGKAYLIKRDFLQARQNFEYLIRQFPNEETRYHAYLYLIRTHVEQGNFASAKEILDMVESDREFPEDLKGKFSLVYADYYLRQNQYEQAIPYLTTATEEIRRHRNKVRYYFILAQLHERLGNIRTASDFYTKAANRNRDYEMEFNAKINIAKNFMGEGQDVREVQRLLRRMLRDEKNLDYLDQVYFAMAEVDLAINDVESAIENLKKSSAVSFTNDYQKALSSLRLGEIYFERQDYKNANLYYDTCMMFLPHDFEGYVEIRNHARNLSELYRHINIVEFQDSVQMIALLSDAERNKLIDGIIAEVIERERQEREMERQQQMNSMLFDERRGGQRPGGPRAPSSGRWYMYDPAQLSYGQNEFRKKWGNRQNEDHWRRRNKAEVSQWDDFDDMHPDSINEEARVTNERSREYYLQDIPLNDSLMEVSHSRILESLFNIARIYKDNFDNYKLALKTYEDMNARYPDNEYLLISYYNLYLLSNLTNNPQKQQTYKDLLIARFPDTHYANLLQNPNYIAELEQKRRENERLYIETYDSFIYGNCNKVNSNANKYIEQNPDGELVPKFEFLKTLCVGKTAPQEDFQLALVTFMRDYPEDELFMAAQNILEYFGTTDIEGLIADLKSRPPVEERSPLSEDAPDDELETSKTFSFDDMADHFYVLKIKTANVDEKRISFEIRNFNIFTFSLRTFTVLTSNFDAQHQFIVVKTFNNQRQAVNYRNMIANNNDVFGNLNKNDYEVFVISEENYDILKSNRDFNSYLQFYNLHY